MIAERLKDDRALPIQTDRTQRILTLMTTDDRELPSEERDTLPPGPDSEPPPGYNPMPSETLKRMPGYDDNQFLHVALAAAADAAHEIRESRKATDIETLLERQTDRILRETSADIGLIRSSIHGLQQSVDALVTRIGNTETQLDAGAKRFDAIELDLAAMRSQMDRLEQMRAHLEGLQVVVTEMKRREEAASAVGGASALPTRDSSAKGSAC